jgi:hypothetical protein
VIGDRIVAHDALRDFAIGDGLDLQRVHAAEFRDLGEGQCRLFDQPHGGGLRHQGQCIHDSGS